MPAFDNDVCFFVIASEGAGRAFLVPQTNGCSTSVSGDEGVANPADPTRWILNPSSSQLPPPALQNAHTIFRLRPTNGGDFGIWECELDFDPAGYEALPDDQKVMLVEAILTGNAQLHIDVPHTGAPPSPTEPAAHQLTIHLRALRTGDYVVRPAASPATGLRAVPALLPGVAAPNFPPGAYGYTCTALGGVLALVGDELQVTAAAAPDPSTAHLELTVTGNVGSAVIQSVLPIDVHCPTQVVALVDRSGSMNQRASGSTVSRWEAARKAVNLFARLYKEVVPNRTLPGGAQLADLVSMKLAAFDWTTELQMGYVPDGEDVFTPASAPAPQIGAPTTGSLTPIGAALVDARTQFDTAGETAWQRRHLLLLSDGWNNRGVPTLADIVGAGGAHGSLQNLATSLTSGVIVHAIGYGPDAPAAQLSAFQSDYDGEFRAGDSDTSPLTLCEFFVDLLKSILPAQTSDVHSLVLAGANAEATIPVDDGVERVIFVAMNDAHVPISALLGGPVAATSAGEGGGFSWCIVDRPRAGNWLVRGAAALDGSPVFAVFDVALRMHCEVACEGVGQPIRLRSTIRHNGVPVRGADVRVALRGPAESAGAVTTTYVKTHGLAAVAKHSGYPGFTDAVLAGRKQSAVSLGRERFGLVSKQVGLGLPVRGDTLSFRRVLTVAAENARHLPLQSVGTSLRLEEVAPGQYEAVLPGDSTQEEGIYNFRFKATGQTAAGFDFERTAVSSVVLTPHPTPAASQVSVVSAPAQDGQVVWTVSVSPRSATGRPLGPGLGDALRFQLGSQEKMDLPTVDHFDGTYSTQLLLKEGVSLPDLEFGFALPNAPRGSGVRISPERRLRRVRVTLDRVRVLDVKEPCWAAPGEVALHTLVTPAGSAASAVAKRLPQRGHVKVGKGGEIEVRETVYEGLIEEGSKLSIALGAAEFDWLLCFQRKQPYARYQRTVEIAPGKHVFRPDDEPNDPESLRDWQVWYTVEVD